MKKLLLLAAIFGLYFNIYSTETCNKTNVKEDRINTFLEKTKDVPAKELYKFATGLSKEEFRFVIGIRNNQKFTTLSKKEKRQLKKNNNK